jgi:hypothetical protein
VGDGDHAVDRRPTERRRRPPGELSYRDATAVGDIDEEGVWFELWIVDAETGGEGAADDVTSGSETQARSRVRAGDAQEACGGDVVVRRRFVRHTPMKVMRRLLRKIGVLRVR